MQREVVQGVASLNTISSLSTYVLKTFHSSESESTHSHDCDNAP